MSKTIQERLRDCCSDIRRTSVPLKDIIPLLQEAADKLDENDSEIETLRFDLCYERNRPNV